MRDIGIRTLQKRFWKEVSIVEEGGRFLILLDGRALSLAECGRLAPAKRELAEAIAEEWRAIDKVLRADCIFVTQCAATMQGWVSRQKEEVLRNLIRYVDGELLCYRAPPSDPLHARQAQTWDPWLKWCQDQHGVRFQTTWDISPITQPAELRGTLLKRLQALDDARLTALSITVKELGSLILGLAFIDGAIRVEQAAVAALLDETVQMERWGEDPEIRSRIHHTRILLERLFVFMDIMSL